MAFTTDGFVQVSSLFAKMSTLNDDRKLIWQNESSTDSISDMLADDYFKIPLNDGLISLGDLILLKDSALSQVALVVLTSTGTAPDNTVQAKLVTPFTVKSVFTTETTDTFVIAINGVAAGDNVLASIESSTEAGHFILTAIAGTNQVTIVIDSSLTAADITFNVLVQSNS